MTLLCLHGRVRRRETNGDDYMDNILAVPCDRPIVLTQEQGARVREEIKNKKPMTQEEKEQLSQKVKSFFVKPDKK